MSLQYLFTEVDFEGKKKNTNYVPILSLMYIISCNVP